MNVELFMRLVTLVYKSHIIKFVVFITILIINCKIVILICKIYNTLVYKFCDIRVFLA